MILFDRYEIERKLGQGSSGEVYLCRDTLLGSLLVTVKLLPKALLDDPKKRSRVASEVLGLKQVQSRYVVKLYDFIFDTDASALIMEYIEGKSLRHLIDSGGEISKETKFSIARYLIEGLGDIHNAGLVHRDIKPENIIIPANGAPPRIIDFGLITTKGTENQDNNVLRVTTDEPSKIVGTPNYIPPEYFTGNEISYKTDIYAATATIFELFTRRDLFETKNLYKLVEDKTNSKFPAVLNEQPPEMQAFIRKGLNPNPARRFESPKAMLNALNKLGRQLDIAGTPDEEEEDSSLRSTVSAALLAPCTASTVVSGAVSGAVYRSVKRIEFSYLKYLRLRRKRDYRPRSGRSVAFLRGAAVLAILCGIAVGGLYAFQHYDLDRSNVVQKFTKLIGGQEELVTIGGVKTSKGSRLIQAQSSERN